MNIKKLTVSDIRAMSVTDQKTFMLNFRDELNSKSLTGFYIKGNVCSEKLSLTGFYPPSMSCLRRVLFPST